MSEREHLLSAKQVDIAKMLVAIIQEDATDDAFMAMISIMAATINDQFDNGPRSEVIAYQWAELLVRTVQAGQAGALGSAAADGAMVQ